MTNVSVGATAWGNGPWFWTRIHKNEKFPGGCFFKIVSIACSSNISTIMSLSFFFTQIHFKWNRILVFTSQQTRCIFLYKSSLFFLFWWCKNYNKNIYSYTNLYSFTVAMGLAVIMEQSWCYPSLHQGNVIVIRW